MMATPCPEWCQVDRPHDRHYAISGQWHGVSVTARPERPRVLQFGVQGVHEPRPALAFVSPDGMQQIDIELEWSDLMELVTQVELAVWRHRNVEG